MNLLPHYIRIFTSLLVIGSFLFLIYYVLSKLPGNNVMNKKNKRIRFLEQLFVSPGVVVYIIKVDDEEFLMGVSNKTINFLQPLKKRAEFSEVLLDKEKNISKLENKGIKDGSA